MKKMTRILIAALAALWVAFPGAFGAYFYLSTEKSFLDSENARVKIESQSIPSVTVRLYRVGDPMAFIRSRKNINRVYIESEAIRGNPAEQLFNYFNIFRSSVRDYARERVANPDTRAEAAGAFPDLIRREPVPKQILVGRMKDYEFLREFRQTLDPSSSWTFAGIDLGTLKNGLYLVEVFSRNAIAYTLVHVSRAGILVKKSDTQLLVRALDKQSGAPVRADVSVVDFETGKEITKGKTDPGTGLYHFNFKKNQFSELLIFARAGADFTFTKASFFPVPQTERLVYLYTDSPVYKYGATVSIKGVIRDYRDSLYAVPKIQSVKLQLTDPRGTALKLPDAKTGEMGTFTADYEVPKDAPTGIYRVVATVGDKNFTGEFRVENYVKPKFKVSVRPENSVVVGNQTVRVRIRADYFTGNRVDGGELKYSLFKTPAREDIFEGDKDIFEDPAYASRIEFLDSRTGKLDKNGEFTVSFQPSQYGVDRDYAFIVKAEVTDTGRSRAQASGRVKVVRAEFFVTPEIGKSVYTEGETVSATVRLTTPDGKPVDGKKLSYQAVLEEGRTTVARGEVTTDSRGTARISFRAEGKGYLRLTVTARDGFGNTVEENVFTWIGQDGGTFVYTSGDITIVFDKSEYRAGEKARVLIVSPVPYAKALVTRERETVFDHTAADFKGNTMLLTVPVRREYTPNFFLTVSFVFNNQVYENTVKVKVPPSDRILSVAVQPDKKTYGPRDRGRIKVTVRDAGNRPAAGAELSVSVVDESLYRVSPEIFPDIRLFFYSYRWNSVTTLNSIALRFYGYSRELRDKYAMRFYRKKVWDFQDFLDRGGTGYAGLKEAPGDKTEEADRKDFRDQILWQGRITADAKGEAVVPVSFPDNLTEWRITAVAVTKDTKVGRGTATVRTLREISADLNIPENVTYVDRINGTVLVQNLGQIARDVNVRLQGEKIKTFLLQSNLTVPAGGQGAVPFTVSPDRVGRFKVKAFVRAAGRTDSLEKELNVMPVSLKKVSAEAKLVRTVGDRLTVTIPATAIRDTVTAVAGLSQLDNPYGVVAEALPFLKSYPYGCVEQTTSAFLPNLVAFLTATKLGLRLPEVFNDRFTLLEQGLGSLYGFQNADGGWGWWNEGSSDVYMTAYVLYAMGIVNREFPDRLNRDSYNRGMRALETLLSRNAGTEQARVYGYYVLSENGKYFQDMVRRTAAAPSDDPYTLSLLVLTAANARMDAVAAELAKKLDALAKTDSFASYWGRKPGDDGDYWFGGDVIVTGVALRALLAAKLETPNRERALAYLLTRRAGNAWNSTRETAEAVYAVAEYAARVPYQPSVQSVDVFVNGKKAGTAFFGSRNYQNTIRIAPEWLPSGAPHSVSFGVPASGGNFVGSLRVEYHDREIAVQSEDRGVAVSRSYYRVLSPNRMEPLGGNTVLKAGEVVLVEISVLPGVKVDYAVLEDGIPAGFLPVFRVNEYNLGVDFSRNTTHTEFGRGLASIFMRNLVPGKYYYLMQAVYPGVYYALPSQVYGMYQPEKRGNGKSDILEVTE